MPHGDNQDYVDRLQQDIRESPEKYKKDYITYSPNNKPTLGISKDNPLILSY